MRRDASTVIVLGGNDWLLGPDPDSSAQFLMFLPLWNFTEGRVEGVLAERWEHSEDNRAWTFYLRRDVRWHDGVPVTAHDVKFSLELLAHPDVQNYDNNIWIGMDSVTVLDDFTFTITYVQPKGPPDDWAVFYPKHLVGDLDPKEFYNWDFWTHPIGNGPYRYVRHSPGTMMELEANPDYYKGKPKIERVIFKFGGGVQLIELLSGNVDISRLRYIDIPMLPADGRFRVYPKITTGSIYTIYWNHRYHLFADPKIRRALTLAINRRELVQFLNLPEDIPIVDTLSSERQFVKREIPEPLPYDPERAKQLLEEAGWRDQDGDGIRERDGKEAKFTLLTQRISDVSVYIQAQLLRVGIEMEVRHLANDLLRTRMSVGEFQAALDVFYTNPRNIKWFSPDSPIGYSNPKIVDLLQEAVFIGDFEFVSLDRVYRELMPIFCKEIPVTFLFPAVTNYVAHRRIRGLEGDPYPDPIRRMAELWLEEEK